MSRLLKPDPHRTFLKNIPHILTKIKQLMQQKVCLYFSNQLCLWGHTTGGSFLIILPTKKFNRLTIRPEKSK